MRETTRFADTVARIVDAAGQGEAYRTAGHFHIKIENGAYMPLVIESWPSEMYPGRRTVSVAHYYEAAGDLVPDPEVEMVDAGYPIGLRQINSYTRCMWRAYDDGRLLVDLRAKREVMSLMAMWGRNLVAQRFIQAAKRMASAVWPA